MKIKLLKSVLENFRDISETFEFGPGRNVFSGPNGCGKTTLVDAPVWCLTGKDSQGSAAFEIKTIRDGKRLEKTDHSVYCTYEVDGTVIEFGRVYRDKYVKKRGADKVKEGNETDYFVDGLKISKTKFNAKITETFRPHFWACSDIRHVAEMHWKERRALIMPMVSQIDKDAIIESIEGLKDFLVIKDADGKETGSRSIDEATHYADQRKAVANKKLSDLTAKIEERGEDTKESSLSLKDAKKAVTFAGAEVDKAQAAIDQFKSGDKTGRIEALRELNDQLIKAESDFNEKKSAAMKLQNDRLIEIKQIDRQLENHREDLQDHRDEKKNLAGKWKLKESERLQVFKSTAAAHPCVYYSESCPYHGQPVADDIKKEMEESFNLDKSKKLEVIVAEQQEFIDRAKEIKVEISRIEKIISDFEAKKKELESVEPDPILSTEFSAIHGDIETKISHVKAKINSEKQEPPQELIKALAEAKAKQTEAQLAEATAKANQGSETRIEDLKAEKQTFAEELDKIEKFQSLYQEFNRKMAEAVEKPLNELFAPVNFRMFKTLENGNIDEVCDVMDESGRPYNGALSNGERIQAGIAIVRVLQEFYNVDAPVFADNAEALTSPIALDCQVIELRASDEFEELTKEV